MSENVSYTLILLEADRVGNMRKEQFDLYTKDRYGNFTLLAEAHDEKIEEITRAIFKRKKTRYLITFIDAMEIMDGLLPSANKILRIIAKEMKYTNILEGYGYRDFCRFTGVGQKYIKRAIYELWERDIIRVKTEKGRFKYMVNPTFFYKDKLTTMFKVVRNYESWPKYEEK